MNVKITKEQHELLLKRNPHYKEYLFGSQLHGVATENSDYDYIRVISDDFYEDFTTLGRFLPNIHSFQFDSDDSTQIIWMTESQFYQGLFSGDGNMLADVVILSGEFENPLFLCHTYKIIKGYLGVAKRDLKIHKDNEKKRFHAFRSLYMASCLTNKNLPTTRGIKKLKTFELPTKEELFESEKILREELNRMLDNGEITMYPQFAEKNSLVNTMVKSNNIKEFKY